ncbi:alanine--glyoxylate aminotransferase 2, mitochondrial [Tetranychus urticae]|uniref:Alanine--glyoxylate aminotransferase 2, mitochondrial n=1 Tax=Tetranychus urticae TaxID=32264 RepID=T1KR84_TETUR|nr:alanine--glyoxylate aminotransferase 2, mitochondrial [Tetranychus urticae]
MTNMAKLNNSLKYLLLKPKQINSLFTANLSSFKLPEINFNPKNYKTLDLDKIRTIQGKHLSPCLNYLYQNPPILVQGKRQYVWDQKGRQYLDMFGGIVTTSVGHCHDRLVTAITEQANKLWHTSSLYLYDEIHKYVSELVTKFPSPLNNVFLCNSGSEANEFAVLLARLYTGSHEMISLRNCYHGCSPNTMALGGIGTWKYPIPLMPGVQHTTCPDPYRGRFGGSKCRDSLVQTNRTCDCSSGKCQASEMYLQDLDEVLATAVPKGGVAGFIIESITGVGGFVQFPFDYVKKAYSKIKQHGGLFISDEVQTGFGRTGSHYWGFEAHGIVPDIVTMAKGIGNGFPLAAVVTSQEIAQSIKKALFFNTFGGNPLACRVGSEIISIIDDENLQENSKIQGEKLIKGLALLRDKYPNVIGDVRGKGLMIGVELIKNKDTKEPISGKGFAQILEDFKDNGVLVGKGGPLANVIRLTPPMCLSSEDIDVALQVSDHVFANYKHLD